jgi:hypothetical protein
MRVLKMLWATLAALLMVASLAAGAASAKTILVARTAKGVIPPGTPITGSSGDLIFVTEAGNLECSANILAGKLANNEVAKVTGSIETESSTGGEAGGLCKTTTPFGPAEITATHLPWPIEFNTKGITTVKKGAAGKIAFTSTFPLTGGAKCTFEASKVLSTFTPGKAGEPIPVVTTTTEQLFKVNRKISNQACPATGKLSGHFSETAGGETILSELA